MTLVRPGCRCGVRASRLLVRGALGTDSRAARQAVLLSVQSPAPEAVFAVVFATVSIGAVTLTLNVLLLARGCCRA